MGGVSKDPDGNATTGASGIPGTEQPGYKGWSATTPVALSASDDVSSTTRSGISGGDIAVQDDVSQQALTGQTATETLAEVRLIIRGIIRLQTRDLQPQGIPMAHRIHSGIQR